MVLNWESLAAIAALVTLFVSIFIYSDKKKVKKFEKMDAEISNLKETEINSLRQNVECLDKKVAVFENEIVQHKKSVEKQFDILEKMQREARDIVLLQVDEIKRILEKFSDKLDKYFSVTQDLAIKITDHIASERKRNEA